MGTPAIPAISATPAASLSVGYHPRMAIYLDDDVVTLPGETLGAVLEAAATRLAEHGRIIVEVSVDGQPAPPETLADLAGRAVADAEVRLVSADPRELAAVVLSEIDERLDAARQMQLEAASEFQVDRVAEGMQRVGEAVAVWQQTQQAVVQTAALVGIDIDELSVEGKPVSETIRELVEQIVSLKEALEARDTVTLADALQYEWPETVTAWQAVVGEMKQRVIAG